MGDVHERVDAAVGATTDRGGDSLVESLLVRLKLQQGILPQKYKK